MKISIATCVLACVPLTAGCLQEFESRAASQGPVVDDASASASSEASAPAASRCPPGSIAATSDTDPSGETILCTDPDSGVDIPTHIVDLPILLDDGGTSTNPCASISPRARQIRELYCATCHAPPAGMGGFNYILDDAKLTSSHSATYTDDASAYLPMIVPGDPNDSWVYRRVRGGAMPPTLPPPALSPPRPTVSDISILESWIAGCLGPSSAAPGSDGGTTAASAVAADGGP